MDPQILHNPAEVRAWRRELPGRVGFVPTMGALHEGHAELLKRMRRNCQHLVLSIFVNPAQFGPKEDLAKYPRTFEADLELARRCGVDAVFYPTSEQMYPPGYSTYVEETALTGPLCGEFRPGHFRGVTTVVLKLFNLVQPHAAYFGLKDAQQFFVLHKMARDLDLDISVEGIPTVRESDGLAMSSRNRYLTAEERSRAPAVYAALGSVARALGAGQALEATLNSARTELSGLGFHLQYLNCLELPGLSRASSETLRPDAPYLIAVAAYLGGTRLIDNIILRPELLARQGVRVHG